MSRRMLAILVSAALFGCQNPPAAPHPSLGGELKRQDDQLVGQRFRTLLDFESDSDTVFAKSDGQIKRSVGSGHTGAGVLFAEKGVTFKIDPLLYGMSLPSEWTLLGAYVRPSENGSVTAELLIEGRAIANFSRDVPAAAWAFVGIDLTDPSLAQALKSFEHTDKHIALRLTAGAAEYDDVLLVNNSRNLVSDTNPDGWTITRSGSAMQVTAPKGTNVRIPLAGAAPNGWNVDEISTRRLCLHRGQDYLTLLPDGRSIANGVTQPPPEIATLDIAEECGRLDRDTPGDANNDAYNERLGSYEVKASSSRLSIKLTAGALPTQSPLIDISGIPAGKLTVMVEGKLIDTVTRLPDGRVLVLLPISIDKSIELTIRSSDNQ